MELGIVGLGRIGGNLARRAVDTGHAVVGYDPDPHAQAALAGSGVETVPSVQELAERLPRPRTVMIYTPHGAPTEQVVQALFQALEPGDLAADGGNSHWADARRRHAFFGGASIRFLDVGTSGGVGGARHGPCFMVGGDREAYESFAPLLTDLAGDPAGVFHAGPPGTGHFVKLVHNAIEFGMIQAIAEGVELLQRWEHDIDLPGLFDTWMHGSVIRSWLVELMGKALREEGDFESLSSYVEDTGEVKWVLEWALRADVPTPAVAAAQTALMQYRDADSAAARAVALLRHQFGGHPVHRRDVTGRPDGARPEPGG